MRWDKAKGNIYIYMTLMWLEAVVQKEPRQVEVRPIHNGWGWNISAITPNPSSSG